uniref:Putative translation initiation factor if-2 n=1 Tax=Anopheles marajoara TaxID=58244 RepID=A0A2M4BWS0_9DIPT
MSKFVEQRICIEFSLRNEFSAADTVRMVQNAFGEDAMSPKDVYKWYKDFEEGRERVEDEERPGRPTTSTDGMGLSNGSVNYMLKDVLGRISLNESSALESTMTEETVPVKRPRGRPKKVVDSPAAAVKPAVASNAPQTPTGEGAGKRAARESATPKKARAEPSPPVQDAASEEEDVGSGEDDESSNYSFNKTQPVAVPAKKRGAPPQEPAESAPTPAKRGRGRPPKKNKKKAVGAAAATPATPTPSAAVAPKTPGSRGRGRPRKNPL